MLRRSAEPDLFEVTSYRDLFRRDRSVAHWSLDYAQRLAARVPAGRPALIQTSMSPTGPFHIGNARDTVTAWLVHRALRSLGRRSRVLLSFDDHDPVRAGREDRGERPGLPLAIGAPNSAQRCRNYLDEIERLGLFDGQDDDWVIHHQHERYRSGTYGELQQRAQRRSRHVAKALGVSDPRTLFRVYCTQCGLNDTRIVELRGARVWFLCAACGAYATTSNPGAVKPGWALDWTIRVEHEGIDAEPAGQDHCVAGSTMDRTRPLFGRFVAARQPVIIPYGLVREDGASGKVSGSLGGGRTLRDLLDIASPLMVAWWYTARDPRADLRMDLRWPGIIAAYAEFDRFLRAARDGRTPAQTLHSLLTDAPVQFPPPGFRTVVGALHASAYDRRLAGELLANGQPGAQPPAVPGCPRGDDLEQRVINVHRWLARHGRDRCWILASADPERVRTDDLHGDGRLRTEWTRDHHLRASLAWFGTAHGPPLRRLLPRFGAPTLVEGLVEHARTGTPTLRTTVLRALDEGAQVSG